MDMDITDDRSVFQSRSVVDWVFRKEKPEGGE
jgi:hypothetical protein